MGGNVGSLYSLIKPNITLIDSFIGMLGYNEEMSAETNMLLVGTFMSSISLITVL